MATTAIRQEGILEQAKEGTSLWENTKNVLSVATHLPRPSLSLATLVKGRIGFAAMSLIVGVVFGMVVPEPMISAAGFFLFMALAVFTAIPAGISSVNRFVDSELRNK